MHHDLLQSPEKHEPPAALCVPAGGAHAPSLNLHFPMQHHAPRVGCARARPSAALHTSGGCLSRVFRRCPLTLTLTRWTTCGRSNFAWRGAPRLWRLYPPQYRLRTPRQAQASTRGHGLVGAWIRCKGVPLARCVAFDAVSGVCILEDGKKERKGRLHGPGATPFEVLSLPPPLHWRGGQEPGGRVTGVKLPNAVADCRAFL